MNLFLQVKECSSLRYIFQSSSYLSPTLLQGDHSAESSTLRLTPLMYMIVYAMHSLPLPPQRFGSVLICVKLFQPAAA